MLIAVMIPIKSFETNIGIETALPKDIYGYIPIYKSMEAARKAFPDIDVDHFNVVKLCNDEGVYNDGVIHTCRNCGEEHTGEICPACYYDK